MTFGLRKAFLNLFVILFAIQIIQFTLEIDAYSFQRPIYFFNNKNKVNQNDYGYLPQNLNEKKFFNNDIKSKIMFKRMTPCYYSPIQCLVKKSIKEDYI
uniref:Uncharacterized protein n=1 Tax=Strongyloides venezuelensis TaxID=75913 RepID=A0A0K0EX96_STRVS